MATFENESEAFQDRNYRVHLDRNWENGNKKLAAQDKRMADIGETDYPGSNEVTQARIGVDGKNHGTLNERLDDNELEVQEARKNADGKDHSSLASRIDDGENEVRKARGKFENLALHETAQDNGIQTNAAGIQTAKGSASYAVSLAKSASSGSPKGFFDNINDLKNKYPNGTSGIFVTTNNGHMWFYSGSWQDIGQYQGTEVGDGSITSEKLSNSVRLNELQSTGGYMFLNWSNGYVANKVKHDIDGDREGSIINSSDYSISIPVTVNTGDVVYVRAETGTASSMVSLWNGNGEYLQSLYEGQGSAIQVIVKIPSSGFVRVTNRNKTYSNNKVIMRKYSRMEAKSLPLELKGAVEWNNVPLVWMDKAYIGSSKNKTNPNKLVQNGGIDSDNRVSQLFFVPQGMIVKTSATTTTSGCVLAEFDESGDNFVKELIRGDNSSGGGFKSYYFDHDAYVRVGTRLSMNPDLVVSTMRARNEADASRLTGKKINFLGDSYVANYNEPVENSWEYKLAQKYHMTYRNYGKNGNGIVSTKANGTPMVDRFDEMENDADYVVVIGGENDRTRQIPLGEFKDGLDKLMEGLINKYTDAVICFFTPWPVANTDDRLDIKLTEYAQMIEDRCHYWGIACYNSNKYSNIRAYSPAFRAKYFQTKSDISHLNAAGHDLFEPRAEAFLNSL